MKIDSNPSVSIIIPVYNLEKYIPECLNSCISQVYTNIEIIVINDGSNDNSKKIIDEYVDRDSRIHVIHTTNKGVTAARFSGIEKAKGRYLYFLDGDDTITPNAIDNILGIAVKSDADLVIGSLLKVDINGQQVGKVLSQLPYGCSSIDVIKAIFTEECIMGLSGNLIKRDIFSDNKINVPRDILVGEDVVSMIQVTLNSNKIMLSNHLGYHYLQRPTSITYKPSIKATNSRIILIWWMHHFFQKLNSLDKKLNDTLSFFILNNWFAFLRTGGDFNYDKKLSQTIYSEYLTNKWAKSSMPFWRIAIIKVYQRSSLLGRVVKNLFVVFRGIIKQIH